MHPARTYTFDALLAGLDAEVARGTVTFMAHEGLRLYTYTDECAYKRLWNPFSLMARGLVLDMEARQVVATPFPKFFNYGEGCAPETPMEPLPDEPFEVTEKMDGSLGIIFYHKGRWRCVTRGSFASEQARWAEKWLWGRTETLIPGHTYLVEIIYAANKIVVPYTFEGLVLLAAYTAEGHEYDRTNLLGAWDERVVPIIDGHSLEDLLTIARTLPSSAEGFVVRFASGRRLKIKGDEYVRVHRLVSRVTPLAVWDMMVAGDDLEVMRQQLPEETLADFDAITAKLEEALNAHIKAAFAIYAETMGLTDKELGLTLKDRGPAARWVFAIRKGDFDQLGVPNSMLRRRFFQQFRPTANRLAGYEPSSVIHRFQEPA